MVSNKQPEALRLARELEGVYPVNIQDQEAAAAELRRLHAANLDCMEWYKAVKSEREELLEAIAGLVGCIDHGSENPTEKLDAARATIAKAIGEANV